MSLLGLAVVLAVGLAGPLLAIPRRARVPVVVGEIVLGILVGRTGTGWVNSANPVLSFLATAGFALVMLVAGSHVPIRHPALRTALWRGALLALSVGVLAIPVGLGVAAFAGTGHGPLYVVLLASSSAALVMPVLDETGVRSRAAIAAVVQVAIADTAAIVALPLVEAPERAGWAAVGVVTILAAGVAIFAAVRAMRAVSLLGRLRTVSRQRHFGLELRLELLVLFGLAGLAQLFGVSVMLAGFVTGVALAALGEPRRLADQLFAVSEGFLAPVFFVWLGASLDLHALVSQPRMVALAAFLGLGAVAVHAVTWWGGQPVSLAVLAAAQLGVPIAAVTIGLHDRVLAPGEDAGILAGALLTIAATGVAAAYAGKSAQQRR